MKKQKPERLTRHSVAKVVSRQVLVSLSIAVIVLLIGSYFIVKRTVYEGVESHAKAVASVLGDIVAYDAALSDTPVDVEHPEVAIERCTYVCQWYSIDYAFILVPDVEHNTLTYIAAAYSEDNYSVEFKDHFVGRVVDYTLTPDELAVWNGEQTFAYIPMTNQFGREYTTILRAEDTYGNRFIVGVDTSYDRVNEQIFGSFIIIALIVAVVVVCVYFAMYVIIRKRVVRPARVISEAMNDFIRNGQRTAVRLDESERDEFRMIAGAFNRMTDNIDSYLANISTLTREQANRQTELDIAAKIQRGFLPPERHISAHYDLRATMVPARDVGGDLYDYLPLDDHRVLTVIADVSGKGVAASIFMAVTLMLIREFARSGLPPADILKRTNATLSDNNAAMLFTTAFIGIYDSEDKTYTYANAGHNLPYILDGEGVRTLSDATGTLLGLFEGEEYTQSTVRLRAGDILFLYTDGVNEATDPQKEFFGTARLENALIRCRAAHQADTVGYIRQAVDEFAAGAEQHDDVTILTLTVKDTVDQYLDVDIHELTKIKDFILAQPLTRSRQLELYLAAEECFVNICSYAFPEGVPQGEKIHFLLSVSDRVELRFEDGGVPFDPLANMKPPEDYDLDTQIGGLGNFIAFSSVDNITYQYENGKNVLTFTKFFEEESL